jgi:hypothetical protein
MLMAGKDAPCQERTIQIVMPALVAGIHVFNVCLVEDVDGRDKPATNFKHSAFRFRRR